MKIEFDQEEGKRLAVIFDVALKAAGLQLVRDVNNFAAKLQEAFNADGVPPFSNAAPAPESTNESANANG